jgi:hypothetical protein
MKTCFIISALLSFVLGLFSLGTYVIGTAHNHYETRYLLLYNNEFRDIPPSWWELSAADVSAQPEKFAKAYEESVRDAYNLARVSDRLQFQCMLLASLLFVVSCLGWWAARRNKRIEQGVVQLSAGGNAAAPRA